MRHKWRSRRECALVTECLPFCHIFDVVYVVLHVLDHTATLYCFRAFSDYSKQLNEQRIKVLSARESAIQEIVAEAKLKLREVSKNPTTYKKLLTDLLVQVCMMTTLMIIFHQNTATTHLFSPFHQALSC